MTSFASDNYSPAHPEIMRALDRVNHGHVSSYGADPWTDRLAARVREVFGPHAMAFPVLTGTAANVVALMAMTSRWAGVVTSRWAHIVTDENGAPERVGGLKLLPVDTTNGKLTPSDILRYAGDLGDVHKAQPVVLALTQCTELGTVYTKNELRALATAAHEAGMRVYLDGSRLANAAASLDVGLRELTTDVGIDVLAFGATKNGGLLGEMIVVVDGEGDPAAEAVPYLRKATMQLAAKQRYVAAQLLAMLGDPGDPVGPGDPAQVEPLWLRNARRANAIAAALRERADSLGHLGVRATQATDANAVFAVLPRDAADKVRKQFMFYDWAPGPTPETVEVRWMCGWDVTEKDVQTFGDALEAALDD